MVTAFAITVAMMAGAVVIIAAGFAGVFPTRERRAKTANPSGFESPVTRLVLAVLGFVGVLVLSRWPVAAIYAGISGFLFPTFARAKRRRREAVARIDAIATWVESLRDTMAASAGVQEALLTSAKVAPAPIRTEVQALAVRLQHETLANSLRRFAADMRHPLADMIVASLVLATTRHAGSLQATLAVTAKTARDYAAMWRNVEAGRSRLYAQVRIAAWISLAVIVGFILANRNFLSPYDGFGGQVALFFICGAFFVSGVALYRLTRVTEPDRPFRGIEEWVPDAVDPETGRVP